jgi:hypothetical protein
MLLRSIGQWTMYKSTQGTSSRASVSSVYLRTSPQLFGRIFEPMTTLARASGASALRARPSCSSEPPCA